jgi:hypothetical protein
MGGSLAGRFLVQHRRCQLRGSVSIAGTLNCAGKSWSAAHHRAFDFDARAVRSPPTMLGLYAKPNSGLSSLIPDCLAVRRCRLRWHRVPGYPVRFRFRVPSGLRCLHSPCFPFNCICANGTESCVRVKKSSGPDHLFRPESDGAWRSDKRYR